MNKYEQAKERLCVLVNIVNYGFGVSHCRDLGIYRDFPAGIDLC